MKTLFEGQTSLSIVNANDFWGRNVANAGIILLNDQALQEVT